MPLRCCFLAVWTVLSFAGVSPVSASLMYDLRLVAGGKTITNVHRFDQVDMVLYAVITGANANSSDEAFINGFGSVLSSGDSIFGSLSGTLNGNYSTNGQTGKQQDLDGDFDLDIGSNAAISNADYIFFRTGSAPAVVVSYGTAIPNGREFPVATFSFTVDTIATFGTGPVMINFKVPVFDGNPHEALWYEDNLGRNSDSDANAQPTVGLPVLIYAVPEPATAGLLVLGLLCAAGRRRRSPVPLLV